MRLSAKFLHLKYLAGNCAVLAARLGTLLQKMPSDPNIGKREREVLTAIVETFISTGEPVGSRTLSRSNREGLSPATIRNVMADLSDAGFLEQPHASAGRIPTTEAYRYYVEQISGTAKLAPQEESMISDSLAGISDVQEFMERTSHVLSLISRNVGVTVASSGTRNALEHVYFSRLSDQKVLAVLVTRSGLVRDRVLRLDLPQAELDLAARYINENFRGWTMESMRAELERRIEQERSEYDRLMNSIEQLYKQGALAAEAGIAGGLRGRCGQSCNRPGRPQASARDAARLSRRKKKLRNSSPPIWTSSRRRCG